MSGPRLSLTNGRVPTRGKCVESFIQNPVRPSPRRPPRQPPPPPGMQLVGQVCVSPPSVLLAHSV